MPGVGTELFTGSIRTKTVAIPDLALQILFAAEQEWIAACRRQRVQHGFRFGEAAQVIKVAVMAISKCVSALRATSGRWVMAMPCRIAVLHAFAALGIGCCILVGGVMGE